MKIDKISLALISICIALLPNIADCQTYTLAEYEQFALQNSKSIEIAKERISAAENLRKSAFTQFLPSLQAVGTYMWNQREISMIAEDALLPVGTKMADGSFGFTQDQIKNGWTVIDGQPLPLDSDGVPFNPKTNPEKIQWKEYALLPKDAMTYDMKNIFIGGIGITQPLFMGFKIRELYNISKSAEEISKLSYENEKEALIIAVDQSYWTVISLMNKQKLATKYVELLEKLYNDVEKSLKEGVATKGDLLNVRVKLNEAHLAQTRANNGVTLAKMALFRLCGMELKGDFGLADQELKSDESSLYEYNKAYKDIPTDINRALDNRFELKELNELYNIAHSQKNIARSRFLPNIAASANYIQMSPNVYNGFSKRFKGAFNAGIVATIPIFHFGDRVYTLRAAKSEEKIAAKRIEQVKELINLEVTQADFKANEAIQKFKEANENIDAAKENLRLAELAYKEGLISLSDILAAQTAYISATSEQIDAEIEVKMSLLILRKSLGISNLSN